jgi:hypothetical protein
MDFDEGDVGYIERSMPHYIENLGDMDLVFLGVFPTPEYQVFRWLSGWRTRRLVCAPAYRYWRGLSAQNRPKGNSHYARMIAMELSWSLPRSLVPCQSPRIWEMGEFSTAYPAFPRS